MDPNKQRLIPLTSEIIKAMKNFNGSDEESEARSSDNVNKHNDEIAKETLENSEVKVPEIEVILTRVKKNTNKVPINEQIYILIDRVSVLENNFIRFLTRMPVIQSLEMALTKRKIKHMYMKHIKEYKKDLLKVNGNLENSTKSRRTPSINITEEKPKAESCPMRPMIIDETSGIMKDAMERDEKTTNLEREQEIISTQTCLLTKKRKRSIEFIKEIHLHNANMAFFRKSATSMTLNNRAILKPVFYPLRYKIKKTPHELLKSGHIAAFIPLKNSMVHL